MTYPPLPEVTQVAQHFSQAVRQAQREEWPYTHWKITNVFPEDICTGILTLPRSEEHTSELQSH